MVWLVFLVAADPGYGYVADGVPELALCVWPGYRRAGLGRMLLDEALRAARGRDVTRVSLSFDQWNPARHLYMSVGFGPAPGAAPGTMLLEPR